MDWKTLDTSDILSRIKSTTGPVEESSLLRYFFPKVENFQGMDLFHCHFNLYHYLYLLKDMLQEEGVWKLYIQLSKCFLLEIPKDSCRYFLEEEIRFCSESIIEGGNLCGLHYLQSSREESQLPELQGIESYYLDRKNFDSMNEELLDKMTRGIYQWLSSPEEINESLTLLDLPESFTPQRLKSRYRFLARQHHPDKKGSGEIFHRIRQAYQILKHWKADSLE